MPRSKPGGRSSRSTPLAVVAPASGSNDGGFAEVVPQHEPYLRRIALRLTGDADLAKDIVQITMVRALNNFDRFEQGTNACAWLVAILRRVYLDHLRHEEVVARAEPQLAALAPFDDEAASFAVSDAALWEAVESLAPDLRKVVELSYRGGLKYRQCAEELGVPPGTVATRLKRAREQLKVLLSRTDS